MAAPATTQEHFTIKLRLLEQKVKFKDVAKCLGKDPAVISKALNHGKFRRVLSRIREVYGV